MTRIDATHLARNLGETTERVADGERIVVQRHGRPRFAMVPYADLQLLEELEDKIDLEEVRARLRSAKGQKRVAWSTVKKRFGI
jgi:prevent-host-death family protein